MSSQPSPRSTSGVRPPAGRGRFVVLEGIDGAGTTTQARLLGEWVRGQGAPVHLTSEPSRGPAGALIRQILSGRIVAGSADDGAVAAVRPETIALLFAADRLDHIQAEIEPLLGRGVHVIGDRYVLSSYAYQSRDCPLKWIRTLNRFAPAPDLTVLLRVPARVALERIARTRSRRERYETFDCLRHVARTYDEQVGELPAERRLVVDGERSIDDITAHIRARVAPLLSG